MQNPEKVKEKRLKQRRFEVMLTAWRAKKFDQHELTKEAASFLSQIYKQNTNRELDNDRSTN